MQSKLSKLKKIDMKIKTWIKAATIIACFSNLHALAQTATTPQVCYSRCIKPDFDDSENFNEEFIAKLRKIQAKKKEETDPGKISELAKEEETELDRLKRSLLRSCKKACSYSE